MSGGPDSLALLDILVGLRDDLRFELRVASLDHGLRGERGAADQSFVAEVAAARGLDFHGATADAAGLARREGLSLEDAARRVRYAFLGEIARRWGPGPGGPPKVALGHTLDDQAETVLMRVIEGTGLDGLAGMPIRREEDGWVLVRPLLRVSREEVESYCRGRRLEPRTDETNLDGRFKRNMIRNRLMPLLAEYNPRVREALARLAETAGRESEVLEEEALRRAGHFVSRGVPPGESPFAGLEVSGRVTALKRSGFNALEEWVRRRLIRRLVRELSGPGTSRGVGLESVERVIAAFRDFRVGSRLELAGAILVEVGYEHVFIARARPAPESGSPVGDLAGSVDLVLPGRTEIPALGWAFLTGWAAGGLSGPPAEPTADRLVVELDPGVVAFPLRVRTRRPGDALRPAGLGGGKKLKDLFISAKVPRAERDTWPLVVDALDRIVWVVGLRADERFRAPRGLDRVIQVRAERLGVRAERLGKQP